MPINEIKPSGPTKASKNDAGDCQNDLLKLVHVTYSNFGNSLLRHLRR